MRTMYYIRFYELYVHCLTKSLLRSKLCTHFFGWLLQIVHRFEVDKKIMSWSEKNT